MTRPSVVLVQNFACGDPQPQPATLKLITATKVHSLLLLGNAASPITAPAAILSASRRIRQSVGLRGLTKGTQVVAVLLRLQEASDTNPIA